MPLTQSVDPPTARERARPRRSLPWFRCSAPAQNRWLPCFPDASGPNRDWLIVRSVGSCPPSPAAPTRLGTLSWPGAMPNLGLLTLLAATSVFNAGRWWGMLATSGGFAGIALVEPSPWRNLALGLGGCAVGLVATRHMRGQGFTLDGFLARAVAWQCGSFVLNLLLRLARDLPL